MVRGGQRGLLLLGEVFGVRSGGRDEEQMVETTREWCLQVLSMPHRLPPAWDPLCSTGQPLHCTRDGERRKVSQTESLDC